MENWKIIDAETAQKIVDGIPESNKVERAKAKGNFTPHLQSGTGSVQGTVAVVFGKEPKEQVWFRMPIAVRNGIANALVPARAGTIKKDSNYKSPLYFEQAGFFGLDERNNRNFREEIALEFDKLRKAGKLGAEPSGTSGAAPADALNNAEPGATDKGENAETVTPVESAADAVSSAADQEVPAGQVEESQPETDATPGSESEDDSKNTSEEEKEETNPESAGE